MDFILGTMIIAGLVGLALLLPGLAVAVRRLHDVDKSGGWLLVLLIPLLGFIYLLYLLLQPSDDGANRFGPPPETQSAAAT